MSEMDGIQLSSLFSPFPSFHPLPNDCSPILWPYKDHLHFPIKYHNKVSSNLCSLSSMFDVIGSMLSQIKCVILNGESQKVDLLSSVKKMRSCQSPGCASSPLRRFCKTNMNETGILLAEKSKWMVVDNSALFKAETHCRLSTMKSACQQFITALL